MKSKKSNTQLIIELVVVLVLSVIGVVYGENKPNYDKKGEVVNTFTCDYKLISLKTNIIASSEDDDYVISGKVLHFVTDKLSMTNADGKEVGKASDEYHFISQDDHEIIVDGNIEYIMEGDFKVFGENYQIYDKNKNLVGVIGCNYLNTHYYLVLNNELVAEFVRTPFRYDFTIKVFSSDEVTEKAALLIICSAYDDVLADRAGSAAASRNNNNN